jgi:hypothetical protein
MALDASRADPHVQIELAIIYGRTAALSPRCSQIGPALATPPITSGDEPCLGHLHQLPKRFCNRQEA